MPPGVEGEGVGSSPRTDRHIHMRYSEGGQRRHSECWWLPAAGVGHNHSHSNWVVYYRGRSLQEGNEVGMEGGNHPVQRCPWGRPL